MTDGRRAAASWQKSIGSLLHHMWRRLGVPLLPDNFLVLPYCPIFWHIRTCMHSPDHYQILLTKVWLKGPKLLEESDWNQKSSNLSRSEDSPPQMLYLIDFPIPFMIGEHSVLPKLPPPPITPLQYSVHCTSLHYKQIYFFSHAPWTLKVFLELLQLITILTYYKLNCG